MQYVHWRIRQSINSIKFIIFETIDIISSSVDRVISKSEWSIALMMQKFYHSPDLFHVQQDLTRATSAPINAKVKQAEKTYETSKKVLEKLMKKQEKEYNIRENPDLCAELDREPLAKLQKH